MIAAGFKAEFKRLHKILTIDPKFFPECVVKQIESGFCLKKLKRVIYLVHFKEGKWDIRKLD